VTDKQKKLCQNIIAKIDDFPTLPTVYSQLSDAIANPLSSAKQIGDIISQDQSSALKVLRVANSAMYGFVGKITSVQQAVVSIGFQETKSIVLALSIINQFKELKSADAISLPDFWKFSFSVGVVARNIARNRGKKNIEEYLIGGIIHGIGKLLFIKTVPELYLQLISHAKENNISLVQIENKVIGMNHSTIAGYIAKKWKLPIPLKKMFDSLYNGYPEGRYQDLSATVHLAFVYSYMTGIGDAGDNIIPKLNKDIWKKLKIENDFFTENQPIFEKEIDHAINILLR
jgi:HD-like signal output (HDOD) protein